MASNGDVNMCAENYSNAGILYELATEEMLAQWNAVTDYFEYQPWIFSLIGSAMVGLSGVLPLLIIPIDEGVDLKNGASAGTLKILLSFAVGGLLGDVFLHLLPEAWASKALNIVNSDGHRPMSCGLWVLTGFLIFIIAEKMFIGEGDNDDDENNQENIADKNQDKSDESSNNNDDKILENNNCLVSNNVTSRNHNSKLKYSKDSKESKSLSSLKSQLDGYKILIDAAKRDDAITKNAIRSNGFAKVSRNFEDQLIVDESLKKNSRKYEMRKGKIDESTKRKAKHISGYLNLMANCIDNFTHGLAVGGSFLVSFRLGALTTFAILIHEIPHEVGDFAILLKSGFTRWEAARAQILTASGGIVGALVAVMCSGSGIESRTSWILPFTAGGFLHIGMVTVLPELLKESNPKESAKQLGALLSGITVMAILTILCD